MKISPGAICSEFGTCETAYCLLLKLQKCHIELRGNLDALRIIIIAAFMAGRRFPQLPPDAYGAIHTEEMEYRERLAKKINRRLGHFGLQAISDLCLVIHFKEIGSIDEISELVDKINRVFANRDYYLPLKLPTSNHQVVYAALKGLPSPIADEICYYATQ